MIDSPSNTIEAAPNLSSESEFLHSKPLSGDQLINALKAFQHSNLSTSDKVEHQGHKAILLQAKKSAERTQLAIDVVEKALESEAINEDIIDQTYTTYAVLKSPENYGLTQSDAIKFDSFLQEYQASTTDKLTGLLNRRSFDIQFENFIQTMLRSIQRHQEKFPISDSEDSRAGNGYYDKFALVIYDFDHFKQINDTYKHLAGDACLKTVAERMQNLHRSEDAIVRWAGDEFATLLKFRQQGVINTLDGANALIEAKRQAVCSEPIKITVDNQEISINVTLSGGAIFLDSNTLLKLYSKKYGEVITPKNISLFCQYLFNAADSALKIAKEDRNNLQSTTISENSEIISAQDHTPNTATVNNYPEDS